MRGRPIEIDPLARLHLRKDAADCYAPHHTINGPAIGDFNKKPTDCPMIKRLRALNAPRFEDVVLPAPPEPKTVLRLGNLRSLAVRPRKAAGARP